jgi:uncharacterized coiled-coil DUF342 family protein
MPDEEIERSEMQLHHLRKRSREARQHAENLMEDLRQANLYMAEVREKAKRAREQAESIRRESTQLREQFRAHQDARLSPKATSSDGQAAGPEER